MTDSNARKRLEDRLANLESQRADLYKRRMAARSQRTKDQLDAAMKDLESKITSVERALK